MNNMLGMCFNRNVLIGLAAVGVGLFALAPNLALAALPFLLIAVCPLSMLVMALYMGRGMKQGTTSDAGLCHVPGGINAAPEPQERLVQLRSQLQQVQEQRGAIARQISELERTTGSAQEPALLLKEPVNGS